MPRHEGFWSNSASRVEGLLADPWQVWLPKDPWQAWLPFPQPQVEPWPGETAFLAALDEVEMAMKEQGRVACYRGYSRCRLCTDHPFNGSREFQHPNWVWPEGFRHYVAAHHVRPRQAFEKWVLSRVACQPDSRPAVRELPFPPPVPSAPGAKAAALADVIRAYLENPLRQEKVRVIQECYPSTPIHGQLPADNVGVHVILECPPRTPGKPEN